MKTIITIIITMLLGGSITSQSNITTNNVINALTSSCTSATHLSVYYPKANKHYSDSIPLQNLSAMSLYKDASVKDAITKGYLYVEVAFMESDYYVCEVKTYKILTPDYFKLTKKDYCQNEIANFAKNRDRYDGNETIYILDSAMNYIDTGAVFTPIYSGKYYIEYDNTVVGLNYLDSIFVNPQPSISFTTPIPNTFPSVRPTNKYVLSSHISHTGVKLESSSPGVVLESGQLTVNVEFIGKFHNLMEYTTVSGKGCRNSLKDTILLTDGLNTSNCPAPLLNTPTYNSIFDYTPSGHNSASIPMCLKRQECDLGSVILSDRNPYLAGDTNYTFEWYMISENVLTNLSNTNSSHTLTIPDNGKNDIMQVMCRTIHKTTSDTSLFFNQIIQTHKRYNLQIDKCNLLGDTNRIEINSDLLSSDFDNYYWRGGSFDRASYNLANPTTGYYKPNGTWVSSSNIINENTAKSNSYRVEYNQTFPAHKNIEWMHSYNALSNTVIGGAYSYNPNVVSNSGTGCYRYDTIELILNPNVDVTYSATLGTGGKISFGGNVNHTVNNLSAGGSYAWNYFTDTLSGSSGAFTSYRPGYIHSGYQITDSYGCSADSTAYNLYEVDAPLPAGIEKITSTYSKIYPNPFVDNFTIETENIGQSSVKIYTMYGKLIYQRTAYISGSYSVNEIGNLKPGTYIIQVIGETKGFSKRITKI